MDLICSLVKWAVGSECVGFATQSKDDNRGMAIELTIGWEC